jgi:hypothetical protein
MLFEIEGAMEDAENVDAVVFLVEIEDSVLAVQEGGGPTRSRSSVRNE